ncbi:MAG: 2-thiouracil desulfurase family protein [Cellvibrionaceae bacterium]
MPTDNIEQLLHAVATLSPASHSTHPPRVGTSACLIGETVRYNGSHKNTAPVLLLQDFAIHLQPLCPEVTAGMGVPRPPVQRIQRNEQVVAILEVEDPKKDHSVALNNAAEQLAHQWSTLDAWVLKARSPSCGLGSSPLFNSEGQQVEVGDGVFAHKICDSHAGLHLDEEDLASPLHSAIFAIALRLSLQLRKSPGASAKNPLSELLFPILKSPRKAEAFRSWLQSCDQDQLGRLLQLPDY